MRNLSFQRKDKLKARGLRLAALGDMLNRYVFFNTWLREKTLRRRRFYFYCITMRTTSPWLSLARIRR
jgi:hypothetical protein